MSTKERKSEAELRAHQSESHIQPGGTLQSPGELEKGTEDETVTDPARNTTEDKDPNLVIRTSPSNSFLLTIAKRCLGDMGRSE